MVPMEQCGAVAQGFAEPLALPVAVHDAIVHRVIGNVIVEAEAVLMTHGQPANALLVSISTPVQEAFWSLQAFSRGRPRLL